MNNKKTILLIEDDALTAITEKSILENFGYSVITAETGEKALETFSEHEKSVNLILTDIDLGEGMDGTETVKIIQSKKDVPVVFLTSHTEREMLLKTEKIRSYGYVVKNSGVTILDASLKMAFKLYEADKKTRESEDKFRRLFETSRDFLYVTGLDGRILEVNKTAGKLTGYSLEELKNLNIKDLYLHPEQREALIQEIKENGFVENYKIKGKGRDSQIFDALLTATMVNDENGNITGFQGSIRDMTDRYQTENKLAETRILQSAIVDSTSDIIWSVDPVKFGLLTFNRSLHNYFLKFHGIDIKTGDSPESFDTSEEIINQWRGFYTRAINEGSFTIQYKTPHPSSLLELSFNLLKRDDSVFGISVFGRDITNRIMTEEKIKNLLNEKELLLNEVHHRIKNNMNTIKGLLSLQLSAETNPQVLAPLRDAESRVQSMILLYDKLYCTENYRELSIKNYLETLANDILGSFPNRSSVEIKTDIEDFILNIQILSPLGIIINELLTNTMKYAFIGREDGVVSLTASLNSGHVKIIIKDNGIGIPDTVNFEKSTGFGLGLVWMLIEQINGRIKIERIEGTVFTIEFKI